MLAIIVCVAKNNAIGLNGGMIYHQRADLKRFKDLTTGHTVVMGRLTFESLPKGALPNRRNIVLTRGDRSFPNTEVFPSLQEALKHCGEEEKVFVIGGSSVYGESLPLADELYLTLVDDIPAEADTFFPQINFEEWEETFRESHPADEQNDQPYTFINLKRKI
ncbi:MAG: dihydrofolate reductase [Bacteroidaceae bacterium]|nr:dihydrofolate reductase [Prevotellaceae bacterium]MDY3063347.1 dihydrofolate reductase [Bacteroidaceae bacterium]